jgi:ribosome-associated toxin RatA of RatAB toxin-antitoxin module
VTVGVVAEGAEELDLGPELRQHHGRDAPAAGRACERLPGVEHLALAGHPSDLDEVDPFDVTDHRDPGHLCEGTGVGKLRGSSTAEIEAPLERVWALVEDVECAPDWQGGMKGMEALERDPEGRAILCEAKTDAKVRTIISTIRFSFDGPTTLTWRQEKGELKSVEGRWELEDLGPERTRATYQIEVDLGRVLGMLVRGPLVDVLRGQLAGARAGELKQAVEAG